MNELGSITSIATFLKSNGVMLKPVGVAEISSIKKYFNVSLPETYLQFLRLMGKGAGIFMAGSSVFYDELYELKEYAEELIIRNGLEPLPDNAFVFYMHQGYQGAYFKLNEGEDPPVYYYSEPKEATRFELATKSLTEFFIDQLITSGFKLP
ncbi:MAG TPA: SMI1/KNR4 family protein [Chitinophagaceae bacterium]|nr:SMI1/KNR4 family protein [Chitinophagaceae bacterium]